MYKSPLNICKFCCFSECTEGKSKNWGDKKSYQNPFSANWKLKKQKTKKVPMAIKLEGKATKAWALGEDFLRFP